MTNTTQDIMRYYFYSFFTVYALFIISFVITIVSLKKKNILKYSLFINIITVISFFFTAIFMGVLADNAAPNSQIWSLQNTIFLAITSISILIQIFLLFKNRNKKG